MRHQFPTDRAERIEQIICNLSIWIPPGKPRKGKVKRAKDDIEELEEQGDDERQG